MKYVVKTRDEEGKVQETRIEADCHRVQGSRMVFMKDDEDVLEVNLDTFVDLEIDLTKIREPEFGKR